MSGNSFFTEPQALAAFKEPLLFLSRLAWAVKNSVLQQFLFAHFLFQTPILCNRNTKIAERLTIYLPFSSQGGEGEKKDRGDLTHSVAMLLPIVRNKNVFSNPYVNPEFLTAQASAQWHSLF